MLQGMDESAFGEFVAALWERQGWQTQVKRDDDRTFVAAQRPDTGEEGLLWAVADDSEIGGKRVQQFASLCEEYEVEEGAVVTAGTVSDHAEKVAAGSDIELLDGDGIEQLVRRNELTHLVEEYGDGGEAETVAADVDGGDDPLERVRAVADRGRAAAKRILASAGGADLPVSGGAVAAVVVAVALLAAGVLYGPAIPFVGGDDAPITAEAATPDEPDTTLTVTWNATVTETIDPNESDDRAYYPPSGERFVVVRLAINNTGDQQVPLQQGAFELRTEDRIHGHQPLADHEGFLDFPIGPGQRYVAWTVFTVPEGTTGTLIYDQSATNATVAVEFERSSTLPAEVTER